MRCQGRGLIEIYGLRVISRLACILCFFAGFNLPADGASSFSDTIQIIQKGKARSNIQKYADEAEKYVSEKDYFKAAESYLTASSLSRASGNYQKAISFGVEAISYAEKARAKHIKIRAMISVAKAYKNVADKEKALEYLNQAAQIAAENKMKGLEAVAYEQIGNIYRPSDLKKTLFYHMKAYDFYESQLPAVSSLDYSPSNDKKKKKNILQRVGHVRNFLDISISLGFTYLALDEYDKAETILEKALPYAEGQLEKQIKLNMSFGDLKKKRGDLSSALDYYKMACESAVSLDLPYYVVKACRRTGRDMRDLGRKEESVQYFRKAIEAIEDQRSMLQSEEMRTNYFEQTIGVYDDMIGVFIDLKRAEEAFIFSERARSRTFLDLLGSKTDLSRGRASRLIDEEMKLKHRMSELQLKLEEEDTLTFKKELDELKEQYASFLERLHKEDPEHADLISVNTLSLKDVQSYLMPGQTLLQFHVMRYRTILWIITRDACNAVVIRKESSILRAALSEIRRSIAEVAPIDQVRSGLRNMYDMLFSNIVIRPGETLIIVSHDILHYLPFHALVKPEGRYLIEDNTVSYLPSSSVLKFVREKSRKIEENIIAFGNPDLGNPALNLRYSEREVREIKKLFPESLVFIGSEATKSRAKTLSLKYNMLHFAVHTEMNEESPKETALMLSADDKEDGNLSVEEIFGLNLSASLVVLNACETELGSLSRGDELVGLSRSFIYAGSPTVITTLWNVNDKSSFFLMKKFYKNINSMTKVNALRSAQISLMQEYPHPFYWAPYLLTGNTE